MRLFVAIDLDAVSRDAIAGEQARIRRLLTDGTQPRWVKPGQLHLTLVFLGEVDPARSACVQKDLSGPVALEPFQLVFRGVGVFPPHGAPRAVWIGAQDGTAQLRALQQDLAARVRRCGVDVEARPFSPHLTIGRWKSSRPSDRRRVVTRAPGRAENEVACVTVDHATLYHSRISSDGPTYTELARANLTTGSRN